MTTDTYRELALDLTLVGGAWWLFGTDAEVTS